MKRITLFAAAIAALASFTACGTKSFSKQSAPDTGSAVSQTKTAEQSAQTSTVAEPQAPAPESKKESDKMLKIRIGSDELTAELSDNSSAEALRELLEKGPLTIEMSDYGGMEKVGELPQSLPRNDEQINTQPGDLILYLGKSITIYYDTNSWSLTRLGKITNVSAEELRSILGKGDVTAVLSFE